MSIQNARELWDVLFLETGIVGNVRNSTGTNRTIKHYPSRRMPPSFMIYLQIPNKTVTVTIKALIAEAA